MGRTPTASTGLQDAYSSGRLPGDLQNTASATLDGNPTTAWQPGFGTNAQIGSTLTYDLAKPQALGGLDAAGDRRRPPLGAHRHDRHVGEPGAHA